MTGGDRLTFTGTAEQAARTLVEQTSLALEVTVEASGTAYIVSAPPYPLSDGQQSLWQFLASLDPHRADWSIWNLAADVDDESWTAVLNALLELRPIREVTA